MSASTAIEIRRVAERDLPAVVDLVRELRPHIDLDLLRERFAEQAALGYELHAAYVGDAAVGLAGFRPVVTLSRGRYLHLDDLVVTGARQGSGIGAALLAHVEAEAVRREHTSVFLDARPTAISFYTRCAYAAHPSPSFWKALKS